MLVIIINISTNVNIKISTNFIINTIISTKITIHISTSFLTFIIILLLRNNSIKAPILKNRCMRFTNIFYEFFNLLFADLHGLYVVNDCKVNEYYINF